MLSRRGGGGGAHSQSWAVPRKASLKRAREQTGKGSSGFHAWERQGCQQENE